MIGIKIKSMEEANISMKMAKCILAVLQIIVNMDLGALTKPMEVIIRAIFIKMINMVLANIMMLPRIRNI